MSWVPVLFVMIDFRVLTRLSHPLQITALEVKVGIDKPPVIDNFDCGADTTILDNPKNCMISSKLFGAAYSRPEEVRSTVLAHCEIFLSLDWDTNLSSYYLQDQVAFGGLRALEFINSAVDHGVEVTSASYGFPLMYDLLVGTVAFKLHPNDKTHNWGRILVRLVPSSDFKRKSAEMSALRILVSQISVYSLIPLQYFWFLMVILLYP